jgi:hypothetical protein
MKIAICMSGQPRTWKKCYPTLVKLIQRLKQTYNTNQVDIFCHGWDFNTLPHAIVAAAGQVTKELVDHYLDIQGIPISEQEKTEFVETYKPVAYLFENQAISKKKILDVYTKGKFHANEHGGSAIEWAGSQFYGIMRAASLKKKHELDNGFRYDVCIRMRYDLFFDDEQLDWFFNEANTDITIPEYNTAYSCHVGKDHVQFPFHRMGDIFWYAESITFDRICDFYRWLPIIGKKTFNKNLIGTEHALYFYIKMLRMNIHPLTVDPKIYRQEDYLTKKEQAGLQGELGHHELI